jgi:hypothetical protein
MPNHVTHRVVITGMEGLIRDFAGSHIHPDDDGTVFLDFNTIIRMPAALANSESSTDASLGFELITGCVLPARFNQSVLDMEWVKEYGVSSVNELEKYLLRHQPERHFEAMHAGYSALMCVAQTGSNSWYEWSVENWGTKWNAYQYSEVERVNGRLEFTFQTAWGVPESIFAKLAEMWPGLHIDIVSFDEGWSFAWRGECGNGGFDGDSCAPTDELYEEVYGEKPDHGEDEPDDEVTHQGNAP